MDERESPKIARAERWLIILLQLIIILKLGVPSPAGAAIVMTLATIVMCYYWFTSAEFKSILPAALTN